MFPGRQRARGCRRNLSLTLLLLCCSTLGVELRAEPLPAISPMICHGFPDSTFDGNLQALSNPNCPDGFALYGAHPRTAKLFPKAEQIALEGICCPLPASDVLLSEHSYAAVECPDGTVATGAEPLARCSDCPRSLRCTKLNTDRYQLGAPQGGVYFGFSAPYYLEETKFLLRDIPAAIRYGLGRRALTDWYTGGCVGFPFGSLLVKRGGKRCGQMHFRQLQYRGLGDDPPLGTPVPMYPDCDDISDVFSPNPECVHRNSDSRGRAK